MKEKIRELNERRKEWWSEHKDSVVKFGLAGAGLYMLGRIHATEKIMNHDKVYVSDNQGEGDIEVIDI